MVTTGEWDEEKGTAVGPGDNVLRCVWDHGPVPDCWDDFDTLKQRVEREWAATPQKADVISGELKERMRKWLEEVRGQAEH